MAKLKMTYEIAMAIGRDAGDRSMREAGRAGWNEKDWNVAADAFEKVYPLEQHREDQRSGVAEQQ